MKTRVRSQRKFSRRSQVSNPSLDPKIFLQEDAQAAEKLIHADNVNKSQLKSLKTQKKVNNKEKTQQFKKRFGHFSRMVELKTPIPIHPNNTFEINEDGEESIEISIRQEKLKKASLRVLARVDQMSLRDQRTLSLRSLLLLLNLFFLINSKTHQCILNLKGITPSIISWRKRNV